jgi:hypothetical protein
VGSGLPGDAREVSPPSGVCACVCVCACACVCVRVCVRVVRVCVCARARSALKSQTTEWQGAIRVEEKGVGA